MITSKTYNGQAGLNYIQSPELAFADIKAVKREGTQYDKYVSGSTNRTYTQEETTGKIFFPTIFGPGGEKIFVLFKTPSGVEPETPPGVCVPVSIEEVTLPNGIVDTPYSQFISLSGSGPFTLTVDDVPDGMTITQSGGNVTVAGTPTTEGSSLVGFTITNDCGSDSFSQSIDIIDNTTNFYVSNLSTVGVKIMKVIPGFFVIQTGAFPINYLAGITGVQGGFTDFVTVFVKGAMFPFTLGLYKNGSLLQSFAVAGDNEYTFDEHTFLNTDQVQIVLN